MSTRVFIADALALMRLGLRMTVDSQPDLAVVGEAATGREVLARVSALDPDVVVMGLRLPELDGLATTRVLVALPTPPRVILVTTFDLETHRPRAIAAGARALLPSDGAPARLLDTIRVGATAELALAPPEA